MQPRARTRRVARPTSGFERSNPAVTAHEIAERTTNQRADPVATDNPHDRQRTIAARTVPAVNVSSAGAPVGR